MDKRVKTIWSMTETCSYEGQHRTNSCSLSRTVTAYIDWVLHAKQSAVFCLVYILAEKSGFYSSL